MERHSWLLFNMDALKGIHHVSDVHLFNRSKRNHANLENNDTNFDIQCGLEEDEKMFVLYQILNGVSGFIIDYFSAEVFKKTKMLKKGNFDSYLYFKKIE